MGQRGFGSDNHSGVHPQILTALAENNDQHAPAYGTDLASDELRTLCKKLFGESCVPYPVFNGTAANVLCLSGLLNSFESVICADTAHLNMDECGAPEKHLGIKLDLIPSQDGKITPTEIQKKLVRLGDQHYSQPKVISITQPTELGTMYSLGELKEIVSLAKKNELFVHIDGARFIYAPHYLKCSFKNLSEDLGVDAISFGGTKNGLLFGELCLLFSDRAKTNFKFRRKQFMQLPSKQRFIAAQFKQLLSTGLHEEISAHGHKLARLLETEIRQHTSLRITQKVQANSVFVEIPQPMVKPLKSYSFFYVWDPHTYECRLMLSFDNSEQDVINFVQSIKELENG